MKKISYVQSLWGVYLYVLFQVVYLIRFGSFNQQFGALDGSIIFVGIVSVALCIYLTNKLVTAGQSTKKQRILQLLYVLAIPFGYFGLLGGGLLGLVGIVIWGLLPFVVLLTIGFFCFKKLEP